MKWYGPFGDVSRGMEGDVQLKTVPNIKLEKLPVKKAIVKLK